MKKTLAYLALTLIVLVQVSCLAHWEFFQIKINLVLALVFGILLVRGFEKNWPAILIAGLGLDLFSGLPFGLISLSLLAATYLVDQLKRNVFGHLSLGLVVFLGVIGFVVFNWLALMLYKLMMFDVAVDWFYNLIYLTALETFYNLILLIFIYYGFKKISPQQKIS